MAVITNRINPQGDEIIRDRIGEILKDELDNQYLQYNSDAAVEGVWIERVVPFDITELNAVNVTTPKGDYENWHQGSMDGVYMFNIDVHTMAPSTDTDGGDMRSHFALKRLLGICRYILSDPKYKTLGFAPGFIEWVRIMGYDIKANYRDRDGLWATALNSAMGRLSISVKANETNTLIVPPLLEEHITQLRLALTNKGYKYLYSGIELVLGTESDDQLTTENGDLILIE